MAEYIDKKYLDRKFQIDMMCIRGRTIFDTKRIIDSLPTADVIERSKIDEAIEEMKNEVKFWDCPVNYQEPLEVQRNKQAKVNSYRHALEILKRNIGE